MTDKRRVDEVTSLSRYGMHVTGMTPEGRKRMPGIVLRAAVRKLGPLKGLWSFYRKGFEPAGPVENK